MKKIVPFLTLILTSSIAYAEPVYLDCNIPEILNGGDVFSVGLDESNGKISQTYPKNPNFSFSTDGIYSPNSISYEKGDERVLDTYIIDRVTLLIQLRSVLRFDGRVFVINGQCSKVEKAKGNKI